MEEHMKKEMKKGISMILSLAMILTMSVGYQGKKVKAATNTAVKKQCATYKGSNVRGQNYIIWSYPMESYLTAQSDGSFMRVQYGSKIGGLLVEYYDKDYNLTSMKIIDEELPVFGGFYATDDNYYVVTGQNNKDKDNDLEVYRITKYDKKWNRIGSTGLKKCNTTYPFGAGSCRIDVSGKYMIIRTCHEMYNGHQANVTIQVDIDKMEITDSCTSVVNNNYGYVSHSFNQFVKIEDGHIIALDHGDAYPRSFMIFKYQTDLTTGKFLPGYSSPCTKIPVLQFEGTAGNNKTGASVGGFEISDDHYLVAANTVVQDSDFSSHKTRNVFVAAVDESTSDVKINYLTDYAEGEETTTTPQLVKISGTRFMVLWTKGDQVYYTLVDDHGEKVGTIHHFEGNLSDCQPVVSGNKVVWYTWNNEDISFYDINTTNVTDHHVTEIHNGHEYSYDPKSDTDDTITFRCTVCGAEKIEKKITFDQIYWRNSESVDVNYWVQGSGWRQKTGTIMTSWIQYTPISLDANTDIEVTSTDESVISIEKALGVNINLIAKKVGTSTVTIKPKYNQTSAITYKITVYDPSQSTVIDKITITPKEGAEPAIEGSNELYYGQKISDLKLNTSKAKFVTPDGTEVAGTLKFNNPDQMPEVGTKTVEYTFTPDDEQYKSYTGSLTINVIKHTPVKDPDSGNHGSNNGGLGSSENGQPTTQKPNTNSNVSVGVKANQTATANGIIYKVTKVENAQNAQVTITSLDKKKSSIVIPDYIMINGVKCKVVAIKKKALYKGRKLKKLTIGKNVQTIEDNAFNGCKNLKSITIKSTVLKKVGKNAIKGIHKKAVIKVPKKQYKKYKKLFGKKSGFKKPMRLKK